MPTCAASFAPSIRAAINWRNVDARKIQVRQPPGARNALGEVKFLFPNHYNVYLHDTPSKSLFERDTRAFSHGCVRVMNPWDFAEALFAGNDQVSGAQLRKRVGGGESWVNLDQHIPVHITYFTAWVDEDGKLQVRDDVYGIDKRVAAALGLLLILQGFPADLRLPTRRLNATIQP